MRVLAKPTDKRSSDARILRTPEGQGNKLVTCLL